MKNFFTTTTILVLISLSARSTIRYVSLSGYDDGAGNSWATACSSLQKVIDASSGTVVDTIFIAEGTYYPPSMYNDDNGKARTFLINKNIRIFGGFPNSGNPGWEQRNPAQNPVILSGIDGSYHVVLTMNVTRDCVLDGVEITGGEATVLAPSTELHGTKIYNNSGGGIYNHNASPTISNCRFVKNRGQLGGAMANYNASPGIVNCLFTANTGYWGSAIYNLDSSPEITNCTIASNYAINGAALFNKESTTTLSSTIVWGNSTNIPASSLESCYLRYCLIEGYNVAGQDNITSYGNRTAVDPGFINPRPFAEFPEGEPGDYRLDSLSPAINTGNPKDGQAGFPVKDLGGKTRLVAKRIDIGAYERQDLSTSSVATTSEIEDYLQSGTITFLHNAIQELVAALKANTSTPVKVEVKKHSGLPEQKGAKEDDVKLKFVDKSVKIESKISPQARIAATEEATVTLFFSKTEFETYNNLFGNANNASLPLEPDDSVENLYVVSFFGEDAPTARTADIYEFIKPDRVFYNEDHQAWEVEFRVPDFGHFFITGQRDVILPVKITAFYASKQERGVGIHWTTTSEINAAHFEIERSTNGSQFVPVGIVTATGESASQQRYDYQDLTPFPGTNFYRLRTVDNDNTFSYTQIVSVFFENNDTPAVFPNPANRTLTLTIGVPIRSVNIYSSDGRQAITRSDLKAERPTSLDIDITSLPPGLYIIKIQTIAGFPIKAKFVKN